MPGLDYNAIMTPNGAAQGFAELASTITRIPQIRREQKLKEIQMALENRRLDQSSQAMQGMMRYHDAMSAASGTRADAAMTNAGAHVDAVGNQNDNRTMRTGAQVDHWHSEDGINQQRANEAGRTNDIRETGQVLEAGKMIPTDTYTPETDAFGHTHSVRSTLPVTPGDRISQGQGLIQQARGAHYGAAFTGGGAPPPMQALSPMQAPSPMQQPTGNPLQTALARAHPADQAAYQRILATGDPQRIQAAQQRLLGAAGAPP